jgi:hypothetical protein
MTGFLRRLFGGRSGGAEAAPAAEAVEYKGFRIRPAPFKAEGQFQTAGVIEKDFSEGLQEHHFVRAEKHATQDEAASFAITKAKQIIDERGDRMFEKR